MYLDSGDRQLLLETFSENGYLYNYEIMNKKSDGTPLWVSLSIQTITINDEIFLFTASQDITEHKRAEAEIHRLNADLEDRIAKRTVELQSSEVRYRSLFENSPVALWEQDMSQVKSYLDELRDQGITDLQAYFESHPEVVMKCLSLIHIVDVNTAAWKMQEAHGKADLMNDLSNIIAPEGIPSFQKELLAIGEGKTRYESENVNKNFSGRIVRYHMGWSALPGYETDLGRVIVYVLDITKQKQAEAEIKQYRDHLEELVRQRTTELETANLQLRQEIGERRQAEVALRESEARYRALFENAHDAIWVYSLGGVVITANSQASELSGYTLDEMIGQTVSFFIVSEQVEDAAQKMSDVIRLGSVPPYERTLVQKSGNERLVEIKVAIIKGERENPLFIQGAVRDITEQKQAEMQIKASLQEKEVLLKEIHHRVKNNMQIISSLLDLQADNVEDTTVRGLFKESQHRIRSMALIHERLYQSEDLAQIDFVEYVESLTNYLLRSYTSRASQIQLRCDIAPLRLSVEAAIPCGLIINELVSNAFKHAFPDGESGEIQVRLERLTDGQLALSVRDNGIGLPADLNVRQTQSLGLTLVTTLVKQLNSTIELNSENGTAFRISFGTRENQN